MKGFILFIVMLAVSSCTHKGGYVPQYILTDSPESKADIQAVDEAESSMQIESNTLFSPN